MIENVVKSIIEAEREAEEIVKTAGVNAKEILIRAKEEGQDIIKTAEVDAENLIAKAMEDAEVAAEAAYNETIKKGKAETEILFEKIKDKSKKAIDLVAKELIKLYGNS